MSLARRESSGNVLCYTSLPSPPTLPLHTPSSPLMGSHQSQSGPFLRRARSPQLWKTHANGLLFHSLHICSLFAASARLIINPPQNDPERPLVARPWLVRPEGSAGSRLLRAAKRFLLQLEKEQTDEGRRAEVEVCV